MKKTSLITDTQSLISATRRGHSIPVYDDGFGPLWIHRDSMGISGIVRAQSFEDAYGICEDEFFPEADDTVEELVKDYGFRREHVKIVKPADGSPERPDCMADYATGKLSGESTGKLSGEFVRWETRETPDSDAWSENELFCEAYGFRPNGPNSKDTLKHGIYSKDLNGDYLEELTPSLAASLEIELVIESEETAVA
jgi:hypothetical protein